MTGYRAPGKLFLVGEYAVLDGAPAVVAAIDRGVRVEVGPGDSITTPGGDDRFVRAALQAVQGPARAWVFEDWNPTELGGRKAGFGGSAAATAVACLAGLMERGASLDALEAIAVAVHHQVQGSGSGLDVRASVNGWVRRYDAASAGPALDDLPPLSVIYSGSSAKTGPRVLRYRAWTDRAAFVDASAELVDRLPEHPVETFDDAWALLCRMGQAAGVDYATPGLQRIVALARDHGGAAKASGAGGGDVAVALIPDADARASFEAACSQEGLTPLSVRIAPGAALEPHA